MNPTLIILVAIIAVAVIALVGVLIVFSGESSGGGGGRQRRVNENLRNLVAAQREQQRIDKAEGRETMRTGSSKLVFAAAEATELKKKTAEANSRMTLPRRLRFAQWPITPMQFRAIQAFFTIMVFIPVYLHAYSVMLKVMSLVLTWFMVDSYLTGAMNKRFEAFDKDYPVVLLQYVSLLKTGMTAIAGLEAAGKGLDQGSLVKAEIELLIERLRLGLTEEQAIGSFGEDVHHPELELFVQSLLLHRRVGGGLSSTLERLAKQVRKRQQFRKQAHAAVGMERSSIYVIALIMGLLLIYLCWQSPELVLPALSHPTGRQIFEAGLALIAFGFFWSKKVTNIKI